MPGSALRRLPAGQTVCHRPLKKPFLVFWATMYKGRKNNMKKYSIASCNNLLLKGLRFSINKARFIESM